MEKFLKSLLESPNLKEVYKLATATAMRECDAKGASISISKGKTYKVMSESGKVATKHKITTPLIYRKQTIGYLVLYFSKPTKLKRTAKEKFSLIGLTTLLAWRRAVRARESRKLTKVKDIFVSLISHEIRTPLTSIYGYVQLLKKRNTLSAQEKKWIEELYGQTSRMSMMIDEMLQLYMAIFGELSIFKKEVDLSSVITSSINRFNSTHTGFKILFINKTSNSTLLGDRAKLIQVIFNALNNSARFSQKNKSVKILLKGNKKNFIVWIVDNGVGIKTKELNYLNRAMEKGVSAIKSGNGLSLYLGRAILKSHGGQLNIYSKNKKGTKIELVIPKN